MKIPKKALDRFLATVKNYQAIVADITARDVSEADTVTVVKDILADVFGYNKYTELTSEQQIRGTYCDLAVKLDGSVKYLIEVKPAGSDLSESNIRQAVNYGAHSGIEWIVLTNARFWRLYRLKFGQPIEQELVSEFSFADINPKDEDHQQRLFLLSREGILDDAMDEFHQHSQLMNKYTIAQIVLSETVVSSIRREMRRLFDDLKVDAEKISQLLTSDVLKREVIEGEKAKETELRIRKVQQKLARQAAKRVAANDTETATPAPIDETAITTSLEEEA